jgi:hypothetical protein
VEYSLSARGRTLEPVVMALKAWGDAHSEIKATAKAEIKAAPKAAPAASAKANGKAHATAVRERA